MPKAKPPLPPKKCRRVNTDPQNTTPQFLSKNTQADFLNRYYNPPRPTNTNRNPSVNQKTGLKLRNF